MCRVTSMASLLLLILVSVGCAHQKTHIKSSVVEYLYPKSEDTFVLPSVPHLKLPLKVGVDFVPEGRAGDNSWNIWSGRSAERRMTEANKTDLLVKISDNFRQLDFVIEEEGACLKPNSLIIDVSCDEGMGFFFAKPTTFKNPMFKYNTTDYYAVDHTPSYLWESATRSISAALVVYLQTVLAGHASWQNNQTIRKAINIDAGVICKPAILSFQNRPPEDGVAH